MAADLGAIAAPGIPGGVGLGIKVGREGAEGVAKNGGDLFRVVNDVELADIKKNWCVQNCSRAI